GIGVGTEIFLIDLAPLVNDESHDAGIGVTHGPGDEGKATDHVTVNYVVVGTAGSVFALASENLEEVAVKRLRRSARSHVFEITLLMGSNEGRPQRTDFTIQLRGPVQAVLGSRRADKSLRIFEDIISVAVRRGVLALSFSGGTNRFEGLEFVLANAAVEDLL